MKYFLKYVVLTLVLIGIMFAGVTGIKGINLYKETMAGVVIEDEVNQIREQENYTTYDQISKEFLDAIVAVEDHRFERHNGFDIISFGRALIRNVVESDYAAGGSTITQQLAKNMFFSFEKTLERKVAELFVARQLESRYTKDEILEVYVNIIYYGDSYTGINDACQGYFGKLPSELTHAESILLAGLPQAPSVYALKDNYDLAVVRGNQVIGKLVTHGYISEAKGLQLEEDIKNVTVKH